MSDTATIDWAHLRSRLAQAEAAFGERPMSDATREQILRARARSVARESSSSDGKERLEVIEFQMGYERYALEITSVQEVLALRDLTPLPGAPRFVAGIVNVRGRIVSVVDLKAFFDLPAKGLPDLNRVMVISDGRMEFGLLVDSVTGTKQVLLAELQPPLATMNGVRAHYLRGITADRLAVLDAGHIAGDPEIIVRCTRG
jgi:purine-binding chemotaxis protein CheW